MNKLKEELIREFEKIKIELLEIARAGEYEDMRREVERYFKEKKEKIGYNYSIRPRQIYPLTPQNKNIRNNFCFNNFVSVFSLNRFAVSQKDSICLLCPNYQ